MCCNRTIIHYNYYSASEDMASTVQGQIDLDLTFQSHARSNVTSLIDILKYTCDVMRDPNSSRQLGQCDDCNGRFTTPQSHVTTCGLYMLCRVVKRKSCETYTGSYWGDL